MSVVCPTVLAVTEEEYKEQMDRITPFATRVQIDLMDGDFAQPQSIDMDKIWWPEGITADIHVMYKKPGDYLDTLIKLKPSLVIIHAEAVVDHRAFAEKLHEQAISAGLCLLADTPMDQVKDIIEYFDHLLVFGGKLGSFGGTADLSQLAKAKQAIELKPTIEIGWDGGVNYEVSKQLLAGGVDVLNAGSFIHRAEDPKAAYDQLVSLIE